ncbi:MAG: hypothetical protein AB1330_12070 [Bacillota bacterium]
MLTFTPKPVQGVKFYGNGIVVEVVSEGVAVYGRIWRQVKRVQMDKALAILSPEQALDVFQKSCKVLTISRMTLAYWRELPYKTQSEMNPV